MLPIEEKKLAYKHPKLAESTSKQTAKFFLHPKIEMLWIEKTAQLGVPALMVGILLHFRSVWCGKDSVTLPKELLDHIPWCQTESAEKVGGSWSGQCFSGNWT